jgi:hypothetical protein
MTTWADLLSDIRTDLGDVDGTDYSDAQLYLWAKDAVNDYSLVFPRIMDRVRLSESEGHYPLPADFIAVIDVETPQDTYLEQRLDRPGVRFRNTGSQPTLYYISGGNLYLNGTPQGDVLLTYQAQHTLPTAEDDMSADISVQSRDEELIRLYVKAKANEQARTDQANLDRYKPGGRRDDNPLMPETESLMDEYQRKLAERIPGGTIYLWRPGRRR